MLALHNITKDYLTGENTVHALKGLDLEFRGSEFVSILGPSGCGKTTLSEYHRRAGPVHERRPAYRRPLDQRSFATATGTRYRNHADRLRLPEL